MVRSVGLLVVAIMMAISLFAEAKIIRVPADYPTIQEGIDAAVINDIVLVADGTYTGDGNKNLDFYGKAITVRSENGPESTIIDCEGSGRGFYFHSHENIGAKVKGFTITNGDSSGIVCDNSSPLIEKNIITNNSASDGGGIYCTNGSSPVIQNNKITNNWANADGGGICCKSSSPTIQNNEITNNWASDDGGGIDYSDSGVEKIQNNEITNNSASDGGGGIYCQNSSPLIEKNIITNNSASDGGGIWCNHYSDPNITNNAITKNEANNGGGLYVMGSSAPSIVNSTIARNLAQYGGGIYCDDSSSLTVLNAILYFNSALVDGDEIYLSDGSITVTYSDIAGGWEGDGNIDENPLFVGFRDYHLQPGSPCIDAGTPDGAPPDDIEGNPRDEFPDMGAYEYQGNGTGTINGHVVNPAGNPIAGAIVIAININTKEKTPTKTNADGYYEIPDLEPGPYLVICIKKGYNPGIAKVVVEAGKTTTRDFELVPK